VAAAGTLVGRQVELGAITEALKRADTAGAVVIGEAGVGKTRLIDAALAVAADAGFVTARIGGDTALADLPLAAFAPLLRERPVGDAGDLVTLRNTLRTMAGGRPLLLGVDDAHFLDDTSAVFVHQLAAELTAFVIVGTRAGVRPPAAITALWKDRLAVRVDVGPLARAEVADLVTATMGLPPAADLEAELWERCRGNPLFATELMLAARDAGTMVERDGVLTMTGGLPSPASLAELLDARLTALDDQQRRAAGLLALGGSIPVDVLEQLVEPDALVRLEAARLIVADEHRDRLEVRLAHPLHAEAVRHTLGQLTARQLRRELADALETVGDDTADHTLLIVTLRLEAGVPSSTELLVRATRLARLRHDPVLAERVATATMEQSPSIGAGLAVANALWEQGRAEEAARALSDPRVNWSAATPSQQATIAEVSAWVHFWGLGRARGALTDLHAAARVAPAERVAGVIGEAAAIEAACARPRAALDLVGLGDPAASTPLGCFAVVTAVATAGRPAAAIDAGALPPIDASGPWQFAAMAYGFALIDAGRVAEASELAYERIEAAIRAGNRHGRCCWTIVLGQAEMTQGRTETGRHWYEQAAQLALGSPGRIYLRRWALSGAMFCAVLLGDLDAADNFAASLAATPPHEATVHQLAWQLAEQWIVAERGDPAGAAGALLAMADDAYTDGRHGPVVRMLADATRTTSSKSTAGTSRSCSTGSSASTEAMETTWQSPPSGSSRRTIPCSQPRRPARPGPSPNNETSTTASSQHGGAARRNSERCSGGR
jgi:hypothetical protein